LGEFTHAEGSFPPTSRKEYQRNSTARSAKGREGFGTMNMNALTTPITNRTISRR
jgi:hypothetical protein